MQIFRGVVPTILITQDLWSRLIMLVTNGYFMPGSFMILANPVRRELHKKYIRQCLNNFKDNNGVIQLIGEEFTGPIHFVKFWLDVIREWEKETGQTSHHWIKCHQRCAGYYFRNARLCSCS